MSVSLSDFAIVAILLSVIGLGIAGASGVVVLIHAADRRRLLAQLTPDEQRRLPPDRFWLKLRIGAGGVAVIVLALWLVFDMLPNGPCGGEDAPAGCADVFFTP